MPKKPKRPRDVNELAAMIGQIATGEITDDAPPVDTKAVARGRARAESLTPERRRAIAKNAAKARWKRR